MQIQKKRRKKVFQIKWKKDATVTGYQVQYAANSKFTKGVKTIKVKSKNKTSKIITVSKKTYYVRIRSYVKVRGTILYGTYGKGKRLK